ncbi:immunity 26/phosphotriesterase HocA family protein [Pedosphaera parvula]|uniref:Immunity protein 26 of polymorphic toxin system n=1 Tax=Pedosphaera parvula (strain Ellin514) TaxID=320771 RepID=B9XL59_PEDPL|nr:immunity 26/phosphotriesterase HocA family protein [Pedosphaera parvula]EEF59410.1 conserved hypothetical protein [Pedosphaera parvula Ellin514]
MKLPYKEGTWFAVPLRQGGFAIGVVARATAKGKVILGYFFGPRRMSVPTLEEVETLNPQNAIRKLQVGDLSLVKGEWPIIGLSKSWERADWPMPVFIRRDPLRPKAWLVYRSDTDPNVVIREEPAPNGLTGLENDSLSGAGAAEIVLTRLLTK